MSNHRDKRIKRPEKLLSYWSYQPLMLILIAVTGIIYNFGMLASPYFEGNLIDVIENKEEPQKVWILLGIFCLTILVVQIMRTLKRYFVRRFANNATYTMRLTVYNNLLHMDSTELKNSDMGKLLSRAISDVNSTVEGMRKLTTEIFDTCFMFAFYIIYLVLFDYQMTLYGLIPVFGAILVAFIMRKAIYNASTQSRKANSLMSSKTFDLFNNAITYRIYGRDQDNISDYDGTLKEYEEKTVKATVLTDVMIPIARVIAMLGLIPVIYFGVYHVANKDSLFAPIPVLMKNNWTIGQFSTYLTTFVLMASKSAKTAKLFGSIESGLASWKRIKPYVKPYERYVEPVEVEGDTLTVSNMKMTVDGKILFKDLSFKAKRNQIIGITGPIASGKSALCKAFVKILPYEGEIKLFGKDISSYSKGEIAGTVSYMGHEADLITDTIKENISLGDEKDVLPSLKEVSFNKDFENMPLKEETIVGNEGVKLSGGQQERIALARTIYHKKGLVILDDPFASVDPVTEREILRNLRKEMEGSIVLLISHRLTSFKDLDDVLVINGDETVCSGSHDELLGGCKTYQYLYSLQKVAGEVNDKHED